jgi:polyisoprenoid-binding protein YceI
LTGSARADAIAPGSWSSVSGKSKVSYKIIHKFHEVEGTSTAADARAMVTPGLLQVQVRVPVASFDSGNSNRDSNAQAVLDAVHNPYVVLKATGAPCEMKAGACDLALTGTILFHGVTQPYTITVHLRDSGAGHLAAAFQIDLILTKHQVELPSLLFIPIDDDMKVVGEIEMEHHS